MELEVYWLELAENKLEEIYSYYSIKASENIAKNLINSIIDRTIRLEKYPEKGTVEINLNNRKQEFRYLIFKNYKIIYWINYQLGRIEIANVFDTRQDPEKISETK